MAWNDQLTLLPNLPKRSPMETLADVQIDEMLWLQNGIALFSGRDLAKHKRILLKAALSSDSQSTASQRLDREFELSCSNQMEGLLSPLGRKNFENREFAVYEDFGGLPLPAALGSGPVSLDVFFTVALETVLTVEGLHRRGLLHGFLIPENILVNGESFQVKLTGLYHGVLLKEKKHVQKYTRLSEGGLEYMAPEQTGRLDRRVDARTDLYGLGAVFYMMLTGRAPNGGRDPAESIHRVLAAEPLPPRALVPGLPGMVEAIVLKLIKKEPSQRYQTARGLRVDLEKCFQQFNTTGRVDRFDLAGQDFFPRPQLPKSLFGRTGQLQALDKIFQKAEKGGNGLVFVSGLPGVGKTAMVQGARHWPREYRVVLAGGKFDQFGQNRPYAGVAAAIGELLHGVLAADQSRLSLVKEELEKALFHDQGILLDMVPDARAILDMAPAATVMDAPDAQNRVHRLLHDFFSTMARLEGPLVLFLDDLQWADPATLAWLEYMVRNQPVARMVLVLAYRENECPPGHPVRALALQNRPGGWERESFHLSPLSAADTARFLHAALPGSEGKIQDLCDRFFSATAGNPFHLRQLLNVLLEEKTLVFDEARLCWTMDGEGPDTGLALAGIQEVMAARIQALPEDTQKLLGQASCLGNGFSTTLLAAVAGLDRQDTVKLLKPACKQGIVLSTDQEYPGPPEDELEVADLFFAHDSLQQAAHDSLDSRLESVVHWLAGKKLKKQSDETGSEQALFAAVNHFNQVGSLLSAGDQGVMLAEANLEAGARSRDKAAFEAAWGYFKAGLNNLPATAWETHYPLCLELHTLAAEAAHLANQPKQAEELVTAVLKNARTVLEKVRVLHVAIGALISQNQLAEAMDSGLYALKLLGYRLPQKPTKVHAAYALTRLRTMLGKKKAESLVDLPPMEDPVHQAAMGILLNIQIAAYSVNPLLMPLCLHQAARASMQHGLTAQTATAIAGYGYLLCALGNLDRGYRMARLAESIMDQYPRSPAMAMTSLMVNGLVRPWKEHMVSAASSVKKGFEQGLVSGNYEWASLCIWVRCYFLFFAGRPLEDVNREFEAARGEMGRLGQDRGILQLAMDHYPVRFFMGASQEELEQCSDVYHDTEKENWLIGQNDQINLCILYFNRLYMAYFTGNYYEALENVHKIKKVEEGQQGTQAQALTNWIHSLSLLSLTGKKGGPEKREILRLVNTNQKSLEKWANSAPMNHLHRYHLVEAERCRVKGRKEQAERLYNQALSGAGRHGFIQDEGLARELFARFLLHQGERGRGKSMMAHARLCYQLWGSRLKVRQLDQRYGMLFDGTGEQALAKRGKGSVLADPAGFSLELLDYQAVSKALQRFGESPKRDRTWEALLQLFIFSAGAQEGCLVRTGEKGLYVQAAIQEDSSGPLRNRGSVFAQSVALYVLRTGKWLALDDALASRSYGTDPHVIQKQSRSVICGPLHSGDDPACLLYLENNHMAGVFDRQRLEVLQSLQNMAWNWLRDLDSGPGPAKPPQPPAW